MVYLYVANRGDGTLKAVGHKDHPRDRFLGMSLEFPTQVEAAGDVVGWVAEGRREALL